jgi:16S rRNA (guanine966-N2)-methyltransferase
LNTSSIRIIGGRHKSYRIVFKATPALRPTTDRAKETLFSWLQFELENKSCLDLFAGTGGLGFIKRRATCHICGERKKFVQKYHKKYYSSQL